MINAMDYKPNGDKKNSDYFNEYLIKIFQRRVNSGLNELLGDISGLAVQVQTGDAISYLKELYFMTPYRFKAGYISDTHKIYCLVNRDDAPVFFVLEPLQYYFTDDITRINKLYPNSRDKFNARYIGELFNTKDLRETKKILESQDFNFHHSNDVENKFYCNPHMEFTRMSDLTNNSLGYVQVNLLDFDGLKLGQRFTLTQEQDRELKEIDAFTIDKGTKTLLKGIDHMATRILAADREDAILEFLCLSPYYFWGAYNIADMNSSTNVNRVIHGDDIRSPAKVFTANNTPYMVNSFENLPMPTENFVRNYGRRMHHIAYEVIDGAHASGVKNIDYVVGILRDEANVGFLAKIFGECKGEPDLKQIFSKHSSLSLLITEYVERCMGFDGFFTKGNVAALTEAAGLDETVKVHHQTKGVIGD